jgi:four helix bundle protein
MKKELESMKTYFDHEKLIVYQESISFIKWASDIVTKMNGNSVLKDQFDRASMSIALNIAEGNGKLSIKDRYRYFKIARASAFECAACLDIFQAKNIIHDEIHKTGKQELHKIISMLIKLGQSIGSRVSEDTNLIDYGIEDDILLDNMEENENE